MAVHSDHGALPSPTPYQVRCDVPGCNALSPLPPIGVVADDNIENRMRARKLAEAAGWYIAKDRGARNQNWDLCPSCAGPNGGKKT